MPDDVAQDGREPSADDFGAAEGVLSRLMPSLGRDTPEYRDKRQALARFRAAVGKDRFGLLYGLRPPRSAVERAELDFFQERITQEQLREVLKADAERPIDAAMLDAFCDAYAERLLAYSRMLQAVIAIATDQREPDAWHRREAEVDRHVEAMKVNLPLWKEQVATVLAFLAELQAERKGEPVRCGDHSAESAHLLANMVMGHAAEGWRNCKEIAARSQTDPSYLYAASASHLFHTSHLPGLPKPQDLQAMMVLEHARARKALQDQARQAKANPLAPANVSIQAGAVNVTAPTVNLAGAKAEGKGKPARLSRLKRSAAEPLILEHLRRRPHDTAEEVATAVGCSVGLVAESAAWKGNRQRLRVAAKEGRDPKAVRLDPRIVNAAGGSVRTQYHASEEDEETIDKEVDRRQQVLAQRIGEYMKQHPEATPQKVAQALGCTAGEVERRQTVLDRLIADQVESAEQDEGGKYAPGKPKRRPGDLPPRQVPRRV